MDRSVKGSFSRQTEFLKNRFFDQLLKIGPNLKGNHRSDYSRGRSQVKKFPLILWVETLGRASRGTVRLTASSQSVSESLTWASEAVPWAREIFERDVASASLRGLLRCYNDHLEAVLTWVDVLTKRRARCWMSIRALSCLPDCVRKIFWGVGRFGANWTLWLCRREGFRG